MLTLAPKAPPQTPTAAPASEMFARGLAHHQSGNLVEAEACYREVLRLEPDHADALHLLGVVAQQNGDYVQAEQLIRSAIASQSPRRRLSQQSRQHVSPSGRSRPRHRKLSASDHARPQSHRRVHSLANSLADQGNFAEAEKYFLEVLRLQPHHADAHYNFGNAKLNQGDATAAIEHYRQAIELQSNCAAYHFNLAHALQSPPSAHRKPPRIPDTPSASPPTTSKRPTT